MKKLIAFFEIPASDFNRAVKFYENTLHLQLPIMECKEDKMAFFMEEGDCIGSISFAPEQHPLAPSFHPSVSGVLISFSCEDMDITHSLIKSNGGTIITPKTKIEAEGKGYFSIFLDSEGNSIGLYSDK